MESEIVIPHIKWPKTPRYENLTCYVTEKLDGTNAVIHIDSTGKVKFGSRNGWLSAKRDNHGFFAWGDTVRHILPDMLGEGYHYGEWVGKSINRNYGFEDCRFYSFECQKILELKPIIYQVPILNITTLAALSDVLSVLAYDLKMDGSKLNKDIPSEGMIVYIPDLGKRFKVIIDE